MTTKEQLILSLPLSVKFREIIYKLHIWISPDFYWDKEEIFYWYVNFEKQSIIYSSNNIEWLCNWLLCYIKDNWWRFNNIDR